MTTLFGHKIAGRILFKQPLHQAIVNPLVDRRKTQTRRIPVMRQNFQINWDNAQPCGPDKVHPFPYLSVPFKGPACDFPLGMIVQPEYKVGDVLIVREQTRLSWFNNSTKGPFMGCEYSFPIRGFTDTGFLKADIIAAIGEAKAEMLIGTLPHDDNMKSKSRPSIHMFDFCARTLVRINKVRIERIGDISYDDCFFEGFFAKVPKPSKDAGYIETAEHSAELCEKTKQLLFNKWDEINGKRGDGGWTVANNRYVPVYDFEYMGSRLHGNGRQEERNG